MDFQKHKCGSGRVREIEANIGRLKSIETKTGYAFKKLKEAIQIQGKSDYSMKKAITYKQNYLNVLEKYSHLDNYDKLMNELKKHSNPLSFFEFMSQNELSQDLTYQSDQYYTQQAFNSFLQDLGIEIEEDTIS